MSRSKPAIPLILAVILLARLSEPALAELVVIVADGVDVSVGAEFPDGHIFDLLDNEKLVAVQLTTKISYSLKCGDSTMLSCLSPRRPCCGPKALCGRTPQSTYGAKAHPPAPAR
jgi:hypothetical protein